MKQTTINITIETVTGADMRMLQAYVASLLEPLITSCDINIRTHHIQEKTSD